MIFRECKSKPKQQAKNQKFRNKNFKQTSTLKYVDEEVDNSSPSEEDEGEAYTLNEPQVLKIQQYTGPMCNMI